MLSVLKNEAHTKSTECIRKCPSWFSCKGSSNKNYKDYDTCGWSPFCFCKSDPSLPDFCHPDALVTCQQSASKSEKLRWANSGCNYMNSWGKGNPRWPLGSSKLPGESQFSLLHSFIHHSTGYQYVHIVCTFSRWVETFLCHKANTFTVGAGGKWLENVFSTEGICLIISSDQGNHFTE